MALNIVKHILSEESKKVLYYSYQISADTIIKRMIKLISHGDEKYYQETVNDIKGFDLIIDTDTNINVLGECFEEGLSYRDVDLIVIDDLQHLSGYYESGDICAYLKEIAKKKAVAILVISNLTKSVEEKSVTLKPLLSDLSDACYGDSAATYADVVMFLYDDEYYDPNTEKKGIAEIIVAKNSIGPSGICELVNLKEIMLYVNLVRDKE